MIEAFLISILANIATEAGKAVLNKNFGDISILDRVEQAFERALKKWSVNKDIRNRELLKFGDRTKLLQQISLSNFTNKSTDPVILELLELFRSEIMSDEIAYNILIENYLQDFAKQFKNIDGKIDYIIEQISGVKSLITSEKSGTTEILPLVVTQDNIDLPRDFFIKNLPHDSTYIPRKLKSFNNSGKDEQSLDWFVGKQNEDEKEVLSELVFVKSRIVVLGNAGTGKSVELKQSAIKIAQAGTYIPIFLSLNTYTADKNIDEHMLDIWKELPKSDTILFLDGLDEIEPQFVNATKRKISHFSEMYPDIKMVISCRTNFYEIPSSSRVGTLREFEAYQLEELTVADVISYVDENYHINGSKFIHAIYQSNLADLVFNPFFLKLLVQNYQSHNEQFSRNRAVMFREFINSRIQLDEVHFEETFNVSEGKYKALDLLRKVSLAMEIIGISVIEDVELHELVPVTDDFQLIKYCSVFNKELDETGKWKFEHNYFREFLCAEMLSKLSFEKVKSIICIPNIDKVLPNWVNTVTQLISILDIKDELFNELINWLLQNDHEVLVNVEREKLSREGREEIFIQIFNYYKSLKIWIDSNKFDDKDLAYFGQSNQCIEFIINEAGNDGNHRITRMNALSILGGFDLGGFREQEMLKELLLKMVDDQKDDSFFVFNIIHTLINCKFSDKQTTESLLEMVGESKSQYIRASMYKYLIGCDEFENYIEYFIEGYKILKTKEQEGRDETNLYDEGANLREGIKSFKSSQALIRIIEFIKTDHIIEQDYDGKDLLKQIIANAIKAFEDEDRLYDIVFKLLLHHSSHWFRNEAQYLLFFFKETNTWLRAFNDALTLIKKAEDVYKSSIMLAYFANNENLELLVEAYKRGEVDADRINRIYWDVNYVNRTFADYYLKIIHEQTNCIIEMPKRIDWDHIRQEKTQKSFDLLFDKIKFHDECMEIFEGKENLTFEEMTEIKKEGIHEVEIDDIYCEAAVDLLRDFAREEPLSKSELTNWLNKNDNYEWYMITEIYQLLKRNPSLVVSDAQIINIKEWFDKKIRVIDFTKAVSNGYNQSFSINNYAQYLVYFMKRFGFECPENVLLDMLSFSFGDLIGVDGVSFEDILQKVEKVKVEQRIVENINGHKIEVFAIFETHAKYAVVNHLEAAFDTIIDDIIHKDFSVYKKNGIIEAYIKAGNNLQILEDAFDLFDIEVKLNTLGKLLNCGEKDFVIKKLSDLYEVETNEDYILIINNLLISASQIIGLVQSIEWIKRNKKSPFSQNGQGLSYYTQLDALPYLIELLRLSYDDSILTAYKLDKLWGIVINGLEFLAIQSIGNFEAVKSSMIAFIDQNKGIIKDVEFINRPLENIKQKVYTGMSVKYNIAGAIELMHKVAI